ncbi:unnamed protein product [Acanthoscelides obtectus]|uniref:Uncharacterized protein n=1 Tax=Acanthoscelides obtectus TaxID=200917 RepID=A0A9P0PPU1_ACAOB|nr:unnamed protein product [Acanthoscelides obtectus]CAK1627402.1 hypothetical protein AOBTE_LOCUS4576 [Acanthoscelides obtectus]
MLPLTTFEEMAPPNLFLHCIKKFQLESSTGLSHNLCDMPLLLYNFSINVVYTSIIKQYQSISMASTSYTFRGSEEDPDEPFQDSVSEYLLSESDFISELNIMPIEFGAEPQHIENDAEQQKSSRKRIRNKNKWKRNMTIDSVDVSKRNSSNSFEELNLLYAKGRKVYIKKKKELLAHPY